MKFYTGVGSRETPAPTLKLITKCATRLGELGWTLRSGGAAGADSAFEAGSENPHIYLATQHICEAAFAVAESIHPAWHACSKFAKRLHARNCYQVLGKDLATPSKFVLCWTPCGAESEAATSRDTGGTRTAIVLASRTGIPVYNLKNPDALQRLADFLKNCKQYRESIQ